MGTERGTFRILIVDDHPSILELLSEFLNHNGYQISATHDAQKALELCKRESFDLVLTDLNMPEVNGWKVAEQAKLHNPDVYVIMVSGSAGQYAGTDLTQLCVDELLSKPVDLRDILRAVDGYLLSVPTQAEQHGRHRR